MEKTNKVPSGGYLLLMQTHPYTLVYHMSQLDKDVDILMSGTYWTHTCSHEADLAISAKQ